MNRQKLFSDVWDGEEEDGTRHRIFWRPDDAGMGATLYELSAGAAGTAAPHALRGRGDVLRPERSLLHRQDGEDELAPGEFVFCPEGRAGLHAFFNRTEKPARLLALSADGFPEAPGSSRNARSAQRHRPWPRERDPGPGACRTGHVRVPLWHVAPSDETIHCMFCRLWLPRLVSRLQGGAFARAVAGFGPRRVA